VETMDLKKAKKILCKNQKNEYSNKETKAIIDFLESYAQIICLNFLTKNKEL